MDGLLIDSEPFWQDAEIEVFNDLGIDFSRAMCRQTMGVRIDQVVAHWHSVFRWEQPTQREVIDRIQSRMIEFVLERGSLLEGAEVALDFVAEHADHIGLATSSTMPVIDSVMAVTGLADRFEVIHSAEFEPYGKPHPGVFMTTAAKLGVHPRSCVALEDSVNGVIAAKAASMKCIAVPWVPEEDRAGFAVADVILASLNELPQRWDDLFPRD